MYPGCHSMSTYPCNTSACPGTPWPAKNDGRVVVRALLRSGLRPESDDQRVLSYATQWGAKMMSPAAAQEQRPPITNASTNAINNAITNAVASPAHSSASAASSATQVGHPSHALGLTLTPTPTPTLTPNLTLTLTLTPRRWATLATRWARRCRWARGRARRTRRFVTATK